MGIALQISYKNFSNHYLNNKGCSCNDVSLHFSLVLNIKINFAGNFNSKLG